MSLAQRITAARKGAGLSQSKLAELCGWGKSQNRISNYENGKSNPSYDDLIKIGKALNIDPSSLAFGPPYKPSKAEAFKVEERKHEFEYLPSEFEPWDSKTPLDEDEVEIPFFTDVEVAAGAGSMLANERIGPKLRFAKSTLKRAGVPPEAAACVKVSGDSMDPALPDGSVVGVNTADTAIRDGKMYAIEHGGLLRIKILQNMPHGSLRLKSYNQAEYPDEILSSEEASEIRVIGRVFWYSVLL